MLDADTDEGKEVLVESAPGPEFVRITVGGKGTEAAHSHTEYL